MGNVVSIHRQASEPAVRYCEDCVYYSGDMRWPTRYSRCTRSGTSLVVRRSLGSARFCDQERADWQYIDVCGPEGRYWEKKPEKPSLWKRLFGRK